MDDCDLLKTLEPYRSLSCRERAAILKTFRRHDYRAGDLIIVEASPLDHVGFLLSGAADACMDSSTPAQAMSYRLGPGDFFGDLACLTQGRALASIACRKASVAYLQPCDSFMASLEAYAGLKSFFLQSSMDKLWFFFQAVHPANSARPAAGMGQSLLSKSIERSVRLIDCKFDQPLTVEKVARSAGLSKSVFSRRFKQATGVSFKTYLNQLRISRAKNMLSREDVNVTEACYAVGFNDTAYFSRTFRRIEGRSPSQFKKNA